MEFPNSFTNLKDPVNMGGTTGTKKYKNSKKNDIYWIVKRSEKGAGGWAQVQSEAMANSIYKVCGIPVPAQKLYPDEKALVLEEILGRLLNECFPNQIENIRLKLGEGFVVDALLANWDVIGMEEDNIIVGNNGNGIPFRIDNGGSLTFRAQGGKKEFGPEVKELKTMRDPKINPNAAMYFGHLTDTVIKDQIQQIIKPNKAAILAATSDELKEVMEKRIDYMLNSQFVNSKKGTVAVEGDKQLSSTWMNETQFLNSKKETAASDESTRAVEQGIIDFFWVNWNTNYDSFNFANANENSAGISIVANAAYAQDEKRKNKLLRYIKNLLQTHNAKISGGFLLKAMGKFEGKNAKIYPSYDMDVYVPQVSVEPFRTAMGKLFLGHQPTPADYSQINASGWATSFFTKNGILSVRKHHRGVMEDGTYEEMDIVEANETTSPINIIKNFDLTFCQNWYDGKNVWLTHADHVEKKHGFLENHYLELLYINKPQTIGRIKKYAGRGFRVSIHNPITKKPEEITDKILAGQTVDYSGNAIGFAPIIYPKKIKSIKMAKFYAKKFAHIYTRAKSKFEKVISDYYNFTKDNPKYNDKKFKEKVYAEIQLSTAAEDNDKYKKILKEFEEGKIQKYPEDDNNEDANNEQNNTFINTRIKPENAKTVINVRNARPNVNQNNFKLNAVPEPTENLEKFFLDHPVPLNFFEIVCKRNWIGSGYSGLNAFLGGTRHPGDAIQALKKQIDEFYDYVPFLNPYFPKLAGESHANYQQRKLYYFFVNLYNVVQKGPAYSDVFKVYRGSRTWYLKEEDAKAQFYYLNSFAATSTSKDVALRFGAGKSYVFYVHPSCRYMSFIEGEEKEVLLTPYHRYLYIKEIKEANFTFKVYLIFPTDLEIPTTFDTFMPWKEGIADLSRTLAGGSDNSLVNNNRLTQSRKVNRKYNRKISRTQKNLKQKNIKKLTMQSSQNKSTMQAVQSNSSLQNNLPVPALENISTNLFTNTAVQNSGQNNFKDYMQIPADNRFTDPIGSFKGKPATPAELEMAAKMVKFFEKNPI